ncbi:hypothetical protein [Leifsonia sp. 71-9]|uniref:hypothetical protein n=1 Tax=Leifsonia sp. 71-9 TaxID=1895934 RepID=UPI0009287972|nr:hypothetical protein [Leifsonia sp. 71-9]OJX72557.1 MAG: hypothetical protein BGO91_01945 [Leifsonia sp. 71-9]
MTSTEPMAEHPTRTRTLALALAIGMLVGAALLGGFFIIVGDQANVAGRAWLTLVLVAGFAGAVLLDATYGDGPNRWYTPASVMTNVVLVALGLMKIWNGWLQPADTADARVWTQQLFLFLALVVLLRLALLITQFYGLYFVVRATRTIARTSALVTLAFLWLTALLLAATAAFPEPDWPDWWMRTAGATALVAVVLAVIPLVVRAFEPRAPRAGRDTAPAGYRPPGYAHLPHDGGQSGLVSPPSGGSFPPYPGSGRPDSQAAAGAPPASAPPASAPPAQNPSAPPQ